MSQSAILNRKRKVSESLKGSQKQKAAKIRRTDTKGNTPMNLPKAVHTKSSRWQKRLPSNKARNAKKQWNPNQSLQQTGGGTRKRDMRVTSGPITVLFDDLVPQLCQLIKTYPVVVGCVAWLSNRTVLEALAEAKSHCSFIVQKEAYLKDSAVGTKQDKWGLGTKLHHLYSELKGIKIRRDLQGQSEVSNCFLPSALDSTRSTDETDDPVRCVGVIDSAKSRGMMSKMHHKFLVFGEWEGGEDEGEGEGHRYLSPKAVWTGSFNLTETACKSLENATILRDPIIARAYYHEWAHVWSLSESCNYRFTASKPEWPSNLNNSLTGETE